MEMKPSPPDCECRDVPIPHRAGEKGNEHAKVCVLLIDDDKDDYLLTKELVDEIRGGRFTLDWASTYEAGLASICGNTHDLYLLDYRLGAKSGIDLLKEAQAKGSSGPIILLTGQGQGQTDVEALNAGADDYLEKAGLTPALLERAMRYALVQHRAAAELERKVKARTEELAKVNNALREANRQKDEFLSTLGHELRNPLAPILNGLEIMRLAGNNPDTITRQRERLERQVAQMTRLVEDLLDVSRITTGKLRLNREVVTLDEVLEAAVEHCRPGMEKAGLELVLNLPGEPVRVSADRGRLVQVFSNLLNNATKYSEPGGRVTVTAECSSEDGQPTFVRVQVRDNGVGIPPELLPKIFELFTQVDHSLNRSQGGLGVGLALVRRLVELHDGTVTARSEGPGTGAEFTVTLPLADVAVQT